MLLEKYSYLLLGINKKKRVIWARKLVTQPPEFWNRVCFTDEVSLMPTSYRGRYRIRYIQGEKLEEKYYQNIRKNTSPLETKVWGIINPSKKIRKLV